MNWKGLNRNLAVDDFMRLALYVQTTGSTLNFRYRGLDDEWGDVKVKIFTKGGKCS